MNINKNDEETYYNIRDNMVLNSSLDRAKQFYYLRKKPINYQNGQ